ncbi:glycosyltransferase [Sphingomonas morindae]|uniref:Glycosyltransferase n=1 Tax=Sphingomonas morindae TaxID=1541170 RepID=A0ABY4X906_9SPHN|nr:glycosyltransferase [Sphingomonas morindae]USI73145.1 glycosyltransferase [Sphingomonas morindae]
MRRPASIAIALHDLPLGGTERIALRLARGWRDQGVAVTLLCGDPRGPMRALLPEGVRLLPLDPPIPRGWGARRRLATAMARALAAAPVDACFIPGNYHWPLVPALAGLPAAIRPALLVQISSPLVLPQRRGLRQAWFEQRMRRRLAGATRCIAMDADGRREADRILGRAITRVVPLPALDPDAPPPRPAPAAPHLLAAGRFIRQKGFDVLIEALARLRRPEIRLTLAGGGPEDAALRALAAARGVAGQIRFAGIVPDIRPLLDAARLFVMPSRFEGYGAVIPEALGAGRAVVATRITPAARDLLGDPATGLMVPPGDPAALAIAIAEALAMPPPDPARLAAGVAAYRLDRGAPAYLAALAEAMA